MPELRQVQDEVGNTATPAPVDPRRFLPDETGGRGPSLPGGNSYADVVAAGNGGINPRVGTRDDGTTIRMFDPDNPNRQGNPTPKPQIDPSSLFSDPGLGGGRAPTPAPRVDNPRVMPGPKINLDTLPGNLTGIGGGRATPLPKTRTRQTVKTPAPRVDNPRVMPAPTPAPTPAPSGDFQSNVDFMNQMATKNAQVGSDGQAVMPSFSYDPATNEYVRDSSAFGLTGDTALTRYSPEEFQAEFGRALAKKGAPAPDPAPKPKPKPKVIPKPKPKVIVDPVKPKKGTAPRGKITDRRTRGRGR